MPLIKGRTRRINMVRHICRLTEGNRDILVSYARMIGDTPDYVLNQLIEKTLATDRDFITWRTGQLAQSGDGRGSSSAQGERIKV